MNISPQTNLSSPVSSEQRTITTGQNQNTSSSKDLASVSNTPSVKVSISVSENAQAASNASLPNLYSRISLAKTNPEQLYVDDDQRAAPFEGEIEQDKPNENSSEERVQSRSEDRSDSESEDASEDKRSEQKVEVSDTVDSSQGVDEGQGNDTSAEERGNQKTVDRAERQQESIEQEQIAELRSRDQEVRAHEQAHRASGGQYAGAASFTYQSGPDGVRYAIGGEVQIDIAPVPNDPEATITKMNIVKAAANAPAEPSSQDRRVAAEAQRIITQAQAEIAQEKRADLEQAKIQAEENREQREQDEEQANSRRAERESQSLSVQQFQKIASLDPNANSDIDALI